MNKNARNLVCGCLLALMLSACVTAPSRGLPPLGGWPERQAVLAKANNWGFSGRIGVKDGDDGFNGNLHWEQRRDYFDLRVSGPLGAGTVLIAGDTERMTVTDKDGEVTELIDVEEDLRRRYGWHIPVDSLRYWALGIPDPRFAASTELNDDGLLAVLAQGGWQVSIDRYRDYEGQAMPRRVTAVREAARVRLVIDRWTFH